MELWMLLAILVIAIVVIKSIWDDDNDDGML